jgi:hypothetical protein
MNLYFYFLVLKLIESAMIDAEFGRKNHGSISTSVIRRGRNHLILELTLEPK